CINVIDTGIGIPSHLLDEIFEAFKQADNTTTRKYEGTGIGLAIARSLCESLGYELFVHSEEGKGSVFSVFFGRRKRKGS
ncbi:MAG: PAS domain-containing sensor histidine kinase, partial [Ignavibacteriales bacterium]|nr:PAS domain-containing sensor histidine kinase [Ignavibacteriales bacterium]